MISTDAPGGALVGEKLVIRGVTWKLSRVDVDPEEATTESGPVVASNGTVAVIKLTVATLNIASPEPKRTESAPPKSVPLIETLVPGAPATGETSVIVGKAWADSAPP